MVDYVPTSARKRVWSCDMRQFCNARQSDGSILLSILSSKLLIGRGECAGSLSQIWLDPSHCSSTLGNWPHRRSLNGSARALPCIALSERSMREIFTLYSPLPSTELTNSSILSSRDQDWHLWEGVSTRISLASWPVAFDCRHVVLLLSLVCHPFANLYSDWLLIFS